MHNDLLGQARELIALDPTRPRRVSLRRAVSSAYYALFHRLIHYAVVNVLGNAADADAVWTRHEMSRWFSHAQMKKASAWFARRGPVPDKIQRLLRVDTPSSPFGIVPSQLVDVAAAFVRLQEERHRADYDLSYQLTRTQASTLVDVAGRAFQDLESVSGDVATRLYALLLLGGDKIVVDR